MGIIDKSLDNCTELWEPVVNDFLKVTLEKMAKLLKPIEWINMNQLKDKYFGKRKYGFRYNNRIIINWSGVICTLIIIAAIVAAIFKFKKYRKKSIDDVLVSMKWLMEGMLCSVLYRNRSNQDKEKNRLNSTEVEVELTPVKEKLKHPIVESELRRTSHKANNHTRKRKKENKH